MSCVAGAAPPPRSVRRLPGRYGPAYDRRLGAHEGRNAMGSSQGTGRARAMRRRRDRVPLGAEALETRRLLTVALTGHEQLLLELINRARAAPQAEAERLGIELNAGLAPGTISTAPKQPLAPHPILLEAAGRHAQDMLDRDYFEHDNPEGQDPTDRARALGYAGGVGENIAFGGSTGTIDQIAHVAARHDDLFRSSGHRTNLMEGDYREVGPAIRFGRFTTDGRTFNASMVAQGFGFGTSAHLTGVAFTDTVVRDRFYSVGEGLSDIVVTATATAGTTFTTTTGPSGGYALPLPAGTFSVVFSRGDEATASVAVSIAGGHNVKLDFTGVFGDGAEPPPAPPPPPPPPAPFVVQSIVEPAAGAYGVGAKVRVAVVLSAPARVSGRPGLPLVVGGRTVFASLVGGTGTTTLHFSYTVGRSLSATEVRLGTTLRDHARIRATDGTRLPATLPAGIAGDVLDGVSIDTVAPRTAGVVTVPESRAYAAGETLRFLVTFNEPVVVGGAPTLTLHVRPGTAAARRAGFVAASPDGRSLEFAYVVQAGDGSSAGRPLRMGRTIGGGTIADAAGNAAVRSITLPATAGIRIAGLLPTTAAVRARPPALAGAPTPAT